MKRKHVWDRTRVEEDCRKAVQLDHNSVKARFFFYSWHYMSRTEESSEEDYASHTEQLKALERVDPVISPSGVTCERAAILEHINKVGKFDPITREKLDPSKLVPNLAIKEAVAAYLERHVWAYKVGS
ncbi:hypothetical protein YC2023_029844 [Brassica napus]